jgi:tetratricopeptide (TPR) repeat protein
VDSNNPVIQLCIEGTRSEYAGRQEEAAALYRRAWEESKDDYEACIAAHYVARLRNSLEECLQWNLTALKHANAVADDSVRDFYPSLYLSLGHAFELLGQQTEARQYYDLAARLGYQHSGE